MLSTMIAGWPGGVIIRFCCRVSLVSFTSKLRFHKSELPVRSAELKSVPINSVLSRFAPLRSAPLRFAPSRFVLIRIALLGSHYGNLFRCDPSRLDSPG
jgi:hypothetical protein